MALADTSYQSTLELLKGFDVIRDASGAIGDRGLRVPKERLNALTEAGLFRILRPRNDGGYESSIETYAPFTKPERVADGARAQLDSNGVGATTRRMMFCENALPLFPRLADLHVA